MVKTKMENYQKPKIVFPIDRETGMEDWGYMDGRRTYRQTQTNDFFVRTPEGLVMQRDFVKPYDPETFRRWLK